MLRLLVYILIFASGVLLGAAFPSYSLQYHQRMQSRLEQVLVDLEPFQNIADQFHDGSLDALIEHHLQSDDPTFYAEGHALRIMLNSRAELAAASSALNGSPLSQARYLAEQIDYETAAATWRNYEPGILLTGEAMKFSVFVGAILCLFAYASMRVIRLLFGRLGGMRYGDP